MSDRFEMFDMSSHLVLVLYALIRDELHPPLEAYTIYTVLSRYLLYSRQLKSISMYEYSVQNYPTINK